MDARSNVWLALAMLGGALLPFASAQTLSLALAPLAISAIALAWHRKLLPLAMLLFGFLLSEHAVRDGLARRDTVSEPSILKLHGTVSGLPEALPGFQRFSFKPSHGKLRNIVLSWYGEHALLTPGATLHISAKIRPPYGEVNPAGFDAERFALAQRIDARGYVIELEQVQAAHDYNIDRWRADLSAALRSRVSDQATAALLVALVVGDTRFLSDAQWQHFRRTGTTHLIAISGLHITGVAAMCALLFAFLLRAFPALLKRAPKRVWLACVALVGGFAYSLLAGFELPAQRTLIALAVFAAAIASKRVSAPWSIWSAALILVLLLDPLAPLNAGFWLSFGAVAALLWLDAERVRRARAWLEFIGLQWRLSLLLIPLGLSFFGELSLLGVGANLLAVPWVSFVVVPLALISSLMLSVPWLSDLLLLTASQTALVFLELCAWLGELRFASWQMAVPGLAIAALAMIGLLWFFGPGSRSQRLLALTLVGLLLVPPRPKLRPGEFEILVFDVGQGLSVLIRTQHNALLYDTGGGDGDARSVAVRSVLPSLRQLGISKLERLIVSHGDLDHAGGLAHVQAAYPSALFSAANMAHALPCHRGQSFELDGVRFEYLHPNQGLPYLGNNSSCVLKVSGRQGAALLPGDIEAEIESRLLARPEELEARVLIAPHHGSLSSSSPGFVRAVRPEAVIYATAKDNRFGFPKAEVKARYDVIGAQQFDTGGEGAVRVCLCAEELEIETLRTTQARRWRMPHESPMP